MIDIILLERVERLGQIGDIVKVRPGYARNFLLPQKKALRANKANIAVFEAQKTELIASNLSRKETAASVATQMSGLELTLVRQAGESGQLYGSVTARDIAEAAREQGFAVDRGQVVIDQPIKTAGVETVRIALHPEVSIMIKIGIAQSLEEAKAMLKGESKPNVKSDSETGTEQAAVVVVAADEAS